MLRVAVEYLRWSERPCDARHGNTFGDQLSYRSGDMGLISGGDSFASGRTSSCNESSLPGELDLKAHRENLWNS